MLENEKAYAHNGEESEPVRANMFAYM